MKKILLDTNFLLIPLSLGVDIFSELERLFGSAYELYIVDRTVDELDNIAETQGKRHKEAAKFGKKLIASKDINTIKTETHKNVDELILKLAKSGDFIVATQDMALKRKLKLINASLVILRQKNHLEVV